MAYKDPEQKKIKDAEYRNNNRAILREKDKDRRIAAKLLILERYGKECQVCGFNDIRALQLDHINGNGNSERIEAGGSVRFSGWRFYNYLIKKGLPDGYQTLCANCNMIKSLKDTFK
jgi:hypothetical protein